MTAALRSKPDAKRTQRTSRSTFFVSEDAAIYRMDATTNFTRKHVANADKLEYARQLAERLCAGEQQAADLRAVDDMLTSLFGSPLTTPNPKVAAIWRRVRASIERNERTVGP